MSMQPWRSYSLDEVKDLSILEVCDLLAVPVTRRGKSYWCKLRDEHTPSAILHPENNTFYDFGSQEHGSNIDLVCCVTGKSFGDAVRFLGEAFSLQPETSADAKKRFLTMSRADYARIGLHADLATKNFTFPIARCAPEKLLDIELRYQMSMNALRKAHPKTYTRIIREKAIPYVDTLRNLYYLDVWNHYCLLQSTGRTVFFYDSERTQAHFASLTQQLEQAERSLYKAGQGTGLNIPAPQHYDPMRVVSRMLTDRLSISLGNCTEDELNASAGGHVSQLSLTPDAYFSVSLDDIRHAASLTKDEIRITCLRQDLPLLQQRFTLQGAKAPSLKNKILSAERQKETPNQTSAVREPAYSR